MSKIAIKSLLNNNVSTNIILDTDSKIINKINEKFTGEEQQLFAKSFIIY